MAPPADAYCIVFSRHSTRIYTLRVYIRRLFQPCLRRYGGGGLSSGALPPPAARPQGGLSGSATHVLWARVCGYGGPALSFWLACRPGGCLPPGWWEAALGGLAFHRCEGRLVSGAVPPPRRLCLGAGSQGSATRVSRARLVWAWGPSTSPTACALASRRCALWGWREGVPRGGALRRCEGRLSSGALPPPAARPQGGLSGSATRVLWVLVCGRGGPALSLWLACPAGGCVPRGRWEAVPGGLPFHRCEGRLVSGSFPPSGRLSLGAGSQGSATRASRARLVWVWGPSSGPAACALASRRCALWGWR